MSLNAPADKATTRYHCTLCPASFARPDHLRRHKAKHSNSDAFICEFCKGEFRRRDVLLRHYQSCKKREKRPLPEKLRRGRPKRACDRCAVMKYACDQVRPCSACTSSHSQCTWSRVSAEKEDVSNRIDPSPHDAPMATMPSPHPYTPKTSDTAELVSSVNNNTHCENIPEMSKTVDNEAVPFLRNFILDGSATIAGTFGYSRAAPVPCFELNLEQNWWQTHLSQCDFPFLDGDSAVSLSDVEINEPFHGISADLSPRIQRQEDHNGLVSLAKFPVFPEIEDFGITGWEYDQHLPSFHNVRAGPFPQLSLEHPTHDLSANALANVPSCPIEVRISELIFQLNEVYHTLSNEHSVLSSTPPLSSASILFNVSNMQNFIHTYFHHFHSHCPIIHRATFSPHTASLALLLAIFLAGSLYSSSYRSVTMTRSYLDLAEAFIFQDHFLKELQNGQHPEREDPNFDMYLQAVQAALLISILQNYEGTQSARARICTVRFCQLAVSARVLKLTAVRNEFSNLNFATSSETFDWGGFIKNETRVRVMHYIFLCDNQYAVFYNVQPRFGAAELATDLPYSDEVFAATTSIECYSSAKKEIQTRHLSLSRSVSTLLAETWTKDQQEQFKSITSLSLFVIISVLHNMIWMAHQSGLDTIAFYPIHRALFRWQSIWDSFKEHSTSQQIRELGFVRHSGEYCWLAKILLHAMGEGEDKKPNETLGNRSPWRRSPQLDLEMQYLKSVLKKYALDGSK